MNTEAVDEFADEAWPDPQCPFELRVSHQELADYLSKPIGGTRMTTDELGALIVTRINREAAGEELYERTVALERAGLSDDELLRIVRHVKAHGPKFTNVNGSRTA